MFTPGLMVRVAVGATSVKWLTMTGFWAAMRVVFFWMMGGRNVPAVMAGVWRFGSDTTAGAKSLVLQVGFSLCSKMATRGRSNTIAAAKIYEEIFWLCMLVTVDMRKASVEEQDSRSLRSPVWAQAPKAMSTVTKGRTYHYRLIHSQSQRA